MAKNAQFNGVARLVLQLAVILGTVAVAWGIVSHQVKDNTEDIKDVELKKLDKEVFQMYLVQQEKVDENRDKILERMDGKMDRVLEK